MKKNCPKNSNIEGDVVHLYGANSTLKLVENDEKEKEKISNNAQNLKLRNFQTKFIIQQHDKSNPGINYR